MNVRPLAFPATTDRQRLWGRFVLELRDAMPALAATLVGIGLFTYGCAGRDSLRPPEPPATVALAAVEPEPREPQKPISKAERRPLRAEQAALRRAVAVAKRAPSPVPTASPVSEAPQPIAAPVAAPPPPDPIGAPPPVKVATAAPPPAPVEAPEPPALKPVVSLAKQPEPAPPAPATPAAPPPTAEPAPTPPPARVATSEATPPPSPKKRVDRKKRPTPMTAQDATRYLALAWEQVTGEPASLQIISVLWAQWALETGRGRWMVDYNYAGLKGRAPDGGLSHWWTWEETDEGARRVRARFRSYASPLEGALDYVSLIVDRYPRAAAAAREGNAFSFVLELDHGGFFTERPKHYVASVVSLATEFRREHRATRF